jgi:HD-GYP domain-containing protein (c-di-GMP phosphodiesterase class II)
MSYTSRTGIKVRPSHQKYSTMRIVIDPARHCTKLEMHIFITKMDLINEGIQAAITPTQAQVNDEQNTQGLENDVLDNDRLLAEAQENQTEYTELLRKERLLKQALDTLQKQQDGLEQAILQCSDAPQAPPLNKKQDESQALRRLQAALMIESDSSSSEDEGMHDDADSFAFL